LTKILKRSGVANFIKRSGVGTSLNAVGFLLNAVGFLLNAMGSPLQNQMLKFC